MVEKQTGHDAGEGLLALPADYSKCNALIYDEEGNLLLNATIRSHNAKENFIVIRDMTDLSFIQQCKLLILTAPVPFSYKGMVRRHDLDLIIKLEEEQQEENRAETRYKTDIPGSIEHLIYNGKNYPLHTKLGVRIVNVSKSGLRVSAKQNTMLNGDRFSVRIQSGNSDKLLTGMIMNSRQSWPNEEYGCRFLGKDGEPDG
jgi:hypothetical protein